MGRPLQSKQKGGRTTGQAAGPGSPTFPLGPDSLSDSLPRVKFPYSQELPGLWARFWASG